MKRTAPFAIAALLAGCVTVQSPPAPALARPGEPVELGNTGTYAHDGQFGVLIAGEFWTFAEVEGGQALAAGCARLLATVASGLEMRGNHEAARNARARVAYFSGFLVDSGASGARLDALVQAASDYVDHQVPELVQDGTLEECLEMSTTDAYPAGL